MEKIDMSTTSVLLDEISKVEDNLRDYNSSLNNLLYEIVPVVKQLVKERNDRLALTEPTSDYVSIGDIVKLQEQIDELKNTDGAMAVMKLQDAIDGMANCCMSSTYRTPPSLPLISSSQQRSESCFAWLTIDFEVSAVSSNFREVRPLGSSFVGEEEIQSRRSRYCK